MRTTIRMNEALRRRALQLASRQGKTFTQIVEEAVEQLLSGDRRARKRRTPKLPVTRGDGLQPDVTLDDNSALIDVMENNLPLARRR